MSKDFKELFKQLSVEIPYQWRIQSVTKDGKKRIKPILLESNLNAKVESPVRSQNTVSVNQNENYLGRKNA